jgi:DNA-damage-inducible protein D
MERQTIITLHRNFEKSAHEKNGVEFWYARELQELLGYNEWRNFEKVIEKAVIACKGASQEVSDHFVDVNKMINIAKGGQREIVDIMLTRYACYLIAQNGDPKKDEIAFAMTYFAVQTRKQEIVEQRLAEWERVQAREKLSASERDLSAILFERGVNDQGFARIRSKGDTALFNGYTTQDMKDKLGVPQGRALADFLPSVTIKAKDLAAEVTNFNVKKDQALRGEPKLTSEHVKNNRNVRTMLVKSGIRPEELPAGEDVKKVERRLKSTNKKLPKNVQNLGSNF